MFVNQDELTHFKSCLLKVKSKSSKFGQILITRLLGKANSQIINALIVMGNFHEKCLQKKKKNRKKETESFTFWSELEVPQAACCCCCC